MLGLVGLVLILYNFDDNYLNTISLVALFGLSSQRLLPIYQQSYNSIASIRSNYYQLNDVLRFIDYKPFNLNTPSKLKFLNYILLKNISFKYNDDVILKNINIKINKNKFIAITGLSGSGKSTLLDILMGLLPPSSGVIYIDDNLLDSSNINSWQANISHVPQNIYILDDTIRSNIAYGIEKDNIDDNEIIKCIKLVGLYDLFLTFPNGLDTKLNEFGSRLSGGQNQRIGISRALYRNTNLIILDEPTSGLDSATENNIFLMLKRLCNEKTIIVVTHSKHYLNLFDEVIDLDV
jgi:ABC-type multidrug transport system fused ATPase/permease subunit